MEENLHLDSHDHRWRTLVCNWWKQPLPNGCAKASATRKGAKKAAIESHDFIMAKVFRREALEDVDSTDIHIR